MKLRLLSADDLRRALPMADAVATMKDAFAALSSGQAVVPQRIHMPVGGRAATGRVADATGTTLVMPAYLGTAGGLGAKLVSFFPGNAERGKPAVTGLVVVLDPETGEPTALADGTFLTAWRTGAASGAASDLLALPAARTAALFGCGAQARTQALAVDAVRHLDAIRVYARTPAAVEGFVAEMQPQLEARLVIAESPAAAVAGAEIVCAATTSPTPVFDGRDLAVGAHVNGVGSFTAAMREIDAATIARARVFVDHRRAAEAEAGDLVIATREGHTDPAHWTELGEVVAATRPGRRSETEVTFFKSVGVAVQDVAAAARALERARELDLGSEIEL